jgi:hypothetical protein
MRTLALYPMDRLRDPAYIEGFVENCLECIGENDPDEERLFRDLWEVVSPSETW